ncbi:MAG: insulinase family protein, partial [Pyrinomonadaceae bacterium]|nr:insulinase family protein [Pyrinomonadaceae bacterium]
TTEVATKTRTFEDKLAPFPAFLIGYKIPARRTPEFNALYLGGQLLYGGDSSRLYQKLVKTDKTVLQLFGSTDERRGPSLVYIGAIPKPNTDPKVIRQVIFDEIKNLSTTAPTAYEMERLRNGLIDGEVRGRQSSLYRSQQLALYTLYDDNPALVNDELNTLLAITPEQIRAAVAKYLNTENRAELDVVPAKKTTAPPAATTTNPAKGK